MPNSPTVTVMEAVLLPIVAATLGIIVKWATSREGDRRWKREYANLGFELMLAAFLFVVSFSFKAGLEERNAENAMVASAIQLISGRDPALTPRLEDPDLGSVRHFCNEKVADQLNLQGEPRRPSDPQLRRFLEVNLPSIKDDKQRLNIAGCQSFLLSQHRQDQFDTAGQATLAFSVVVLLAIWLLSVVVQEWGYERRRIGSRSKQMTTERLRVWHGILLPDAVGLVFLLMTLFVIPR